MFKYNKEMFEGHEVEVAVDGDKKYYVARSVAPMFGLKNNITYQMEKHCGKENCVTISPKDWVPANTLRYKVTAITEDGFHRLVTRYQAVEKQLSRPKVKFIPCLQNQLILKQNLIRLESTQWKTRKQI